MTSEVTAGQGSFLGTTKMLAQFAKAKGDGADEDTSRFTSSSLPSAAVGITSWITGERGWASLVPHQRARKRLAWLQCPALEAHTRTHTHQHAHTLVRAGARLLTAECRSHALKTGARLARGSSGGGLSDAPPPVVPRTPWRGGRAARAEKLLTSRSPAGKTPPLARPRASPRVRVNARRGATPKGRPPFRRRSLLWYGCCRLSCSCGRHASWRTQWGPSTAAMTSSCCSFSRSRAPVRGEGGEGRHVAIYRPFSHAPRFAASSVDRSLRNCRTFHGRPRASRGCSFSEPRLAMNVKSAASRAHFRSRKIRASFFPFFYFCFLSFFFPS
ncbi:hypothetical protein HPB48_016918 [Haemaphysalis longicornis]|uniref:Uncharacterized protein n=1 Tax=Haemaphysalis longicornis TaxID=44386 RepID=A0A9J6G2B9_HAELO|nr:hypothetical protein HPB48_016918 [Haemaphysalis longicornis]